MVIPKSELHDLLDFERLAAAVREYGEVDGA